MINITIELKENNNVGVYKTMSRGQTDSISVESEDYTIDLHGTRNQILEFINDLQKSAENM